MTHASLFSGIGGFDLAAEWAGWQNIFHCEWNPFGQKILKHYFPNSKSYNDITKTDFSIYAGQIDVLTGGFPCQPYSNAGKRLGKADERHLFPEMLRAIKEIKPKWIIGENVRGLVSWNEGLVFNEVYADLESEGYEVQSFLIPAAGINAPHQRYRIWFIAYNVTYANMYGQQQKWGHDKCSENVDGCNNEKFRSTNTKDIDRCNTYGNSERQSESDNGVSNKRIFKEDKPTNTNGICSMDKDNRESEKSSRNAEFKNNKSRTLVQVGQDRIQLPNNRGLEFIEKSLSSSDMDRPQDDLSGINGLERDASYTNCSRYRGGGFESKSNLSEKQKMGKEIKYDRDRIWSKIEGCSTNVTNTFNRFKIGNWEKFPTESPICGRNDGISDRLDNITFSKWRKESIKAYGNAIVPQVAYQIFKTINEFENISDKI